MAEDPDLDEVGAEDAEHVAIAGLDDNEAKLEDHLVMVANLPRFLTS